MIAKTQKINDHSILALIEELATQKNKLSSSEIVKKLKELVPEYISNNSKFEKLDKVL